MSERTVYYVAHCDINERLLGVWKFGVQSVTKPPEPEAFYPPTPQGQIDREVGEISVEGAGDTTWELVVERLTHSSNMNNRWFVLLDPGDKSLAEVFDENSLR